MAHQPAKMSDMLKEMSEFLFREPEIVHSSEATHVALLFANVAWNECVGLDLPREGNRHVWETIEAEKPDLWNEFKSIDIDGIIDELVQFKKARFAADRRRILTCGRLTATFVWNGYVPLLRGSIPNGKCGCMVW